MDNMTLSHILQIQEAMRQNRLVVFVGAGASASSGVPTWAKLIQSFQSELPQEMYDEGDALKTAEAYRELRGDVEYLAHVKKVLKYGEVTCGLVHEAIMEMDPCHIVTTNYDDLLEQAAMHNNKQYYVVAKDEDLPLNKGEKMIVKMHGDFANNNIVLTENDYYDYRRNFPLINSFLMSLFATKVVLFIGFSFSDINLKFILREVASVLGSKMQRVYMLTDEKKDPLAYSYYNSKSVQLLTMPEDESIRIIKEQAIECKDEEALVGKSKALYHALRIIHNYDAHYNSILEKAESALSLYQDQIRYWGKNLSQVFNVTSSWLYLDGDSIILTSENYKKQFEELCALKTVNPTQYEELKGRIEWVRKKLAENGIRYINKKVLYTEQQVEKWITEQQNDITDLFYQLMITDIEKRLRILSQRSLSYSINDLALPFLQYRLGMYKEAYLAYKMLAPEMWKRRKYLLYFICLYNMRASFGRAYMQMSQRKDASIREWDYVYKYNFKEILAELPIEKNIKSVLDKLVDGVLLKNLLIKSSGLKDKLSDQKKSAEKGGLSINGNISQLMYEYEQAFDFCNENYILIDAFEDMKDAYVKIGEGLICSVTTPSDKNQLQSKIEKLPATSIELYVFQIEPSNLIKILRIAEGKKIPVEDDFKQRLYDLVKNLALDSTKNHREHLLDRSLVLDYISNIILLQQMIVDPIEMPDLYKVVAEYWDTKNYIEGTVKNALLRIMEKQKPSPTDSLAMLTSISRTSSYRENEDANLVGVLANHIYEGGLVYKDFPGPEYLSQYQGVECVASYYNALSDENKHVLKEYVRNNVGDIITLLKSEIHTEAHFVTSALIEKMFPMAKKIKCYTHPEEYASYLMVRLLNKEEYGDIHDVIKKQAEQSEVLQFLCNPEDFPKEKIRVHWLEFVTKEQLKKLYENKEIRKKAIIYCDTHKWATYLVDKLLEFEKE